MRRVTVSLRNVKRSKPVKGGVVGRMVTLMKPMWQAKRCLPALQHMVDEVAESKTFEDGLRQSLLMGTGYLVAYWDSTATTEPSDVVVSEIAF